MMRNFIKMDYNNNLTGLSEDEIQIRKQKGLVNGTEDIKTKSTKDIVLGNLITPFNILNQYLLLTWF